VNFHRLEHLGHILKKTKKENVSFYSL